MSSNVSAVILIATVGMIAWLGSIAALHYALQLGLVQSPNHRSSHVQPTPHSGGLGILLGGSIAGFWVAWGQSEQWWVILGLAFVLGMVGLLDDIRHLPALVRFGVQLTVCVLLLWSVAGAASQSPIPLPFTGGWGNPLVWLLSVILVFAGVWWINLFNFMDGIDGIAGSQAVFMLVAGAVLGAWFQPLGISSAVWVWMLAIAAATVGFLILNWPPARIFMGDVGSTYLAFMILALALLSVRDGWLTFPVWLVLGAIFFSDATVALLRRMLAGERWFEAHRSHAYQRLSRRWGAHRPVTLLTITVNVLWLAPLAWACLAWPKWAWACVVLAYGPLVVAMVMLGAGKKDGL
jgi:Fuc2NAc and GlcNAc transferase